MKGDKGSEFNSLAKRQILENKKIHRKRLLECRPAVDNSMPVAYKYPLIKSKKELLIEGKLFENKVSNEIRFGMKLFKRYFDIERCTEIERANRILL